jgi:hypothetical protein
LLIESEAHAVLALKLQAELIESGSSCRIEIRQKNIKAQLSNLATQGFDSFASVGDGIKSVSELDIRKLD